MAFLPSRERLFFLYRSEEGRIDRETWTRGALGLVGVLLPLTLIWLLLLPYTSHDLAKSPFFVPQTAVAYAYLAFYSLIVLLVAASWVNLAAKRFRDLDRPAPLVLAGLLPFAGLVVGAAHWLQPQIADLMPRWQVAATDVILVAIAAWTVIELGWRRSPEAG
jgi:uncharacterized membrane protein YhaH (DUF805 family)